jgi:uncharacterized phage protein (TIGR01671 family)
MREIKFKVWDKSYEKMRYNYLAKSGDKKGDWILFQGDDSEGEFGGWNNPYPREMFELLQFTGLKDMDGAEIYEGDIIRFQGDYPAFFEESFFKVEHGHYNNELGYEDNIMGYGWYGLPIKKTEDGNEVSFDEKHSLIPGDEMEDGAVIGNRFENPELLAREE